MQFSMMLFSMMFFCTFYLGRAHTATVFFHALSFGFKLLNLSEIRTEIAILSSENAEIDL